MTEQQNFGFGKFVPGFDFLQNLSKGATQQQSALPGLSSWVAPTLNVEELDKRIGELKAVLFWLDQNSRALGATIQALELQKMTLATLKGMNFNMADIANALQAKGGNTDTESAARSKPSPPPHGNAAATQAPRAGALSKDARSAGKGAAAGVIDPLQWWGALTQQFQEIAAGALKDVAVVAQPGGESVKPAARVAKSAGASVTGGTAGRSSTAKRAARKNSR